MSVLLVVHHTPSPTLAEMLDAALAGARDPDIEGVQVVLRPALTCTPTDVINADGYLFGTPANLGYMSGALKHFFDTVYYVAQHATARRPYGLYVHGGSDTTGAVRSVESAATGMGLRRLRPPVEVAGALDRPTLAACSELGAVLAVELMDT